MAEAERPVTDDEVPAGETPEEGNARVYSGSVVRYGEDNRMVLTDRLNPGDYLTDSGPLKATEEDGDN